MNIAKVNWGMVGRGGGGRMGREVLTFLATPVFLSSPQRKKRGERKKMRRQDGSRW